jgi:hypothetical protein
MIPDASANPNPGITVTLTRDEEVRAVLAAFEVNENKEHLGKNTTAWTRRGEQVDPTLQRADAFRAEYAVAKLCGLPPLTWQLFDGGDGKIDLVLPYPTPLGQRVQVKHRSERNRDLATSSLDHHDELKADLYVLAWPALDRDSGGIDLIGWCTRDDFLARIMDLSRPPVRMLGLRYEMVWHRDLRPMQTLVEAVDAARHAYETQSALIGAAVWPGYPPTLSAT